MTTDGDTFVEVTYLPVSLRCPSLSRLHLTSADGGAVCERREADDLAFLLDSFEVDAPSGGLTGRGFRQYFAHALGEDFDEARDDLRKALGREA